MTIQFVKFIFIIYSIFTFNVFAAVFVIEVGKGDVPQFSPQKMTANIGDVVVFNFVGSGTYNVIQSAGPIGSCVKKKTNSSSLTPFQSKNNTKLSIAVTDDIVDAPGNIFFYCGVRDHCKYGMWGVIYVPNSKISSTSSSTTTATSDNNSESSTSSSATSSPVADNSTESGSTPKNRARLNTPDGNSTREITGDDKFVNQDRQRHHMTEQIQDIIIGRYDYI
ncbi:15345_t:CDS:2 [Acaulospora morrowiae]|uniref:15345_t:CDS:1 n=1 Tax=Acaulospora morrowiae TaxID=94023 RepID=A0A9N9AWV6_9GLOM|nr:15345_t:CDS:2 [Acaulospora morrowiae]